ncbi:Npr-27 [Aphelenchoides bicaudatus]|nr:Npr-27 [Aphelenchoides bicaudatus]
MMNLYLVACIYSIVFLFGALGNLFVIFSMIYSKLCCMPKTNRAYSPRERSRIFIFMLAIADLFVLLTIPFSLWQILSVKWVFGSLMCRLNLAIDSSGKSLSIVLLTAMAIERYLIVCTRWRYISSPMRISLIPIVVGILFGVILPVIPQVLYTSLYTIPFERNGRAVNETVCLLVMPERLASLHTTYMFISSFGVPLLVMTFCYFRLVRHVKRKYRERISANRSPASSVRIHRPKYLCGLTRSICRIAIFHFTCLAPFWFFTLSPVYGIRFSEESAPEWFRNAKLYATLLPYINSAGNCIFYAFLNRDIRKQIWRPSSRLRSGYTATAIQSATMSFNNAASECNESN